MGKKLEAITTTCNYSTDLKRMKRETLRKTKKKATTTREERKKNWLKHTNDRKALVFELIHCTERMSSLQ